MGLSHSKEKINKTMDVSLIDNSHLQTKKNYAILQNMKKRVLNAQEKIIVNSCEESFMSTYMTIITSRRHYQEDPHFKKDFTENIPPPSHGAFISNKKYSVFSPDQKSNKIDSVFT